MVSDSKISTHTGQPQQKRGIGCLGLLAIVVGTAIGLGTIGVLLIVLFFGRDTRREAKLLPLDESAQLEFHSMQANFPRQYDAAKNEIQKSAVFNACNLARRDFLRKGGYVVIGWSGTIAEIRTDQGGDVAHVEIKSNLRGFQVMYMNEPILSIFPSTLLKKGTRVYNQVAELTVGQKVRFSGRFLPHPERGVWELSLTEKGCVDAPEFILAFDDIEAESAFDKKARNKPGITTQDSINQHRGEREKLEINLDTFMNVLAERGFTSQGSALLPKTPPKDRPQVVTIADKPETAVSELLGYSMDPNDPSTASIRIVTRNKSSDKLSASATLLGLPPNWTYIPGSATRSASIVPYFLYVDDASIPSKRRIVKICWFISDFPPNRDYVLSISYKQEK